MVTGALEHIYLANLPDANRDHDPLIIKIEKSPFKGLVISIEDIKLIGGSNATFAWNICSVPDTITDAYLERKRKKLNTLIKQVFHDIIADIE